MIRQNAAEFGKTKEPRRQIGIWGAVDHQTSPERQRLAGEVVQAAAWTLLLLFARYEAFVGGGNECAGKLTARKNEHGFRSE